MMSVNPALKGHPDRIEAILRASTVTHGITDPVESPDAAASR